MVREGMLAAVLVAVAGCGVGAPDQQQIGTIENSVDTKAQIFNPPSRDCRIVSARPMVTGTIRSAPDVGMLEVASVGSNVQSMFFETQTYGPETRHGVAEFEVPAISGRIIKSTLHFTDVHGWTLQNVPSDYHRLSLYNSADGQVTIDDYVREGDTFATFATDMNEMNPAERSFDITGAVGLGGRIGARIELDRMPTQAGSYGSGFEQFRVDFTVCSEGNLAGGEPIGDPSGPR